MRKLWVKAWTTLDGVFDADTMDHWWQNTNSPERMQYITAEYAQGDAYLLGRVTYEMLWPGWSTQTTGAGPGPLLNRMHKYVVSNGQRHHHRRQCDPGPFAAGNRSDRRVPVPSPALHHGPGQALLPRRDALNEAAAGRKQNASFRDPGACLPACGPITCGLFTNCHFACDTGSLARLQ
jgi:hypothetical protein